MLLILDSVIVIYNVLKNGRYDILQSISLKATLYIVQIHCIYIKKYFENNILDDAIMHLFSNILTFL